MRTNSRKERVLLTLSRVMADRAATPAEKETARKLYAQIIDRPLKVKQRERSIVHWDFERHKWSKKTVVGVGTMPSSGRPRIHIDFSIIKNNECTRAMFNYMIVICDFFGWQAPQSPPSYEDASNWLEYYVPRYKRNKFVWR